MRLRDQKRDKTLAFKGSEEMEKIIEKLAARRDLTPSAYVFNLLCDHIEGVGSTVTRRGDDGEV